MHVLTPFLLLLPTAFATTTIHYYKNPSCNTGTDNGSYDAPLNQTANDLECHVITNAAKALYINGLDDGCGVIAYQSNDCTANTAAQKLALKGDCFYLANMGTIKSWRSVCGSAMMSASASFVAAAPTSTVSATSNATAAASGASTTSATSAAHALTVGGNALLPGVVWSVLFGAVVVAGELV